jgi:pimeloyl-ACP methyl ester carboxylesterase
MPQQQKNNHAAKQSQPGLFKGIPTRALLLWVLLLPTGATASPGPFENSYFVTIEGVELHFRHWVPDPVHQKGSCLLIHGFSGSTFSWEGVAQRMQQLGFEVVALDIPPFGYSDKSARVNKSVTGLASLVLDFLDELFPGQAWHLAGHSMGGAIAQAMGLMRPEAFHTVTLVAPAAFSRTRAATNDKDGQAAHPPTSIETGRTGRILGSWPLRHIVGRLAERYFITPRRVRRLLASALGEQPSQEQVAAYSEPLRLRGTAAAILSSGRNSQEVAGLDAADMQVPTLAVWGDGDQWVPYESRRQVVEKIPGVDVQLIPGAGHNPMETHPEEFLAIWAGFLQAVLGQE